MTDKELLEYAAKAAGIDAEFHSELGYGPEGMWLKGARGPDNSKYWNPLTDDGDALRLSVRLKIYVKHFPFLEDDAVVYPGFIEVWDMDGSDPLVTEYLEKESDRLDVTKLVIVRAAAEIGKSMS